MLKKIIKYFQNKLGTGSTLYSILKPCTRCVYGKRYEPILVFSLNRGFRVLVNYNAHTYLLEVPKELNEKYIQEIRELVESDRVKLKRLR